MLDIDEDRTCGKRNSWYSHALSEMAKDVITRDGVLAVLRGGVVEPAELERGSWRYRVRAASTYVVVAFRSASALVVVTAWRTR